MVTIVEKWGLMWCARLGFRSTFKPRAQIILLRSAMGRNRVVGIQILGYLEDKGTDVTFKELYGALKQFSKQGIRNSMYILLKEGRVKKSRIKNTRRVRFRLKKHHARTRECTR